MVYQRLMEHAAATRPMPMSLPNVLTYGRIAAVPGLVACLFFLQGDVARWSAFALFVFAGITDWLDGYLARVWEQQSTLGRMLDPIADKLLVGAVLMMLVHDNTITGWSIWAAIIILVREILVSGLREFLAELNVKIHVTQLAKWKTTMQMIALGGAACGPGGGEDRPRHHGGRPRHPVDRGAADAVDRLRLSQGRSRPCHGALV